MREREKYTLNVFCLRLVASVAIEKRSLLERLLMYFYVRPRTVKMVNFFENVGASIRSFRAYLNLNGNFFLIKYKIAPDRDVLNVKLAYRDTPWW